MNAFPPLCSAAGVRARLAGYGLTPNKALGQNFLTDPAARDALCGMTDLSLPVLEIGPGLGALTEGLLARGSRVVAVEKDAAMVRVLRETLADESLTVIEADFLKADLFALHALLGGGEFAVAGNLPYYATTPIVLRLLACGLPIRSMVLMLQQEAAERFFAPPGHRVYGPLTVAAACAYTAGETLYLPPSAYFPQPNVHSSVVLLTRRAALPAGFLPFLRDAFAMRRKTLFNNLLAMGFPREQIGQTLSALSIPPDARACALPADQLLALYARLSGS